MKKILLGLTLGVTMMVLLAATNLPQSWTLNTAKTAFTVLMKDGAGTVIVPTNISGTYTATLSGTETSGTTVSIAYSKVGNTVTINIPAIGPSAVDASGPLIFSSTNSPTFIRPSADVIFPLRISHNSAWAVGMILVGSNGTLYVYSTIGGSDFTTNAYQVTKASVSYSVQ